MNREPIIGDSCRETATVPPDLAGKRLDAAAARLFSRYSRSRLQDWIAQGHLSVNGAPVAEARAKVASGDVLDLDPPAPADTRLQAQDIGLDVVFEDPVLAVIDKPPGLTVHPGAGRPDRTLVNALLHRWPRTRTLPRGGLVHRLDKDTSGLLVVGLTAEAHAALTRAMQERRIRREYDAIVVGAMRSGGTLRTGFGRHPRHRTRMSVLPAGREAVTHYRVLERYSEYTRLRVRLETGRTHQIRVHLQHLRHPVLGDPVYGGRASRSRRLPEDLRRALADFPRQALHAGELAFAHPVSGEALEFRREPPADMQRLIAALRRHAAP